MTPATALLHAAPGGLTFRELMIACYGKTSNAAQRHDLLRALDEFEQDGKVRFSVGTDRWYWQSRLTPSQRPQEAIPATPALPQARSPVSVQHTQPDGHSKQRQQPRSGLRAAILALLHKTGRPMKAREIVTELSDWPENAVFTWLSRMKNVGDLRQDTPGGPYRTPGMLSTQEKTR